MLDIQVIEDPAAAAVALEPMRSRLLSELAAPASAATLAARVGLARQKVNYHLNAPEAHGAGAAGPRTQMGRADRTAARGDGRFLRRLAGCPGSGRRGPESGDRQAVRELPHCGWPRVVREVGDLVRRATETGKRLATLAVDTEIRFRSAADRAAFSNELAEAITRLVSKYHDESAPGGRAHRLVVVAHPLPQKPNPKEPS